MTSTNPPKEFVRSNSQKMIAGVCGGIGEYFGVDANLVRVLTVLGTVVSGGTVALIYFAAWMLMPSR
ncbi:PspC domain-containing protein [Rhodococcus sp. BP22]|uniref:PspC domain-containing protein n=1 Tax=Rhodococcus sp. BP22 TaxID=2758566 RepID=UPI00164460C4|nr:PspC domain-containing protein [Rhodococcus sp. BP22]